MPKIKIGLQSVKALGPVAKPTIYYDDDLTGFGLKVLPSGVRSWIIEYRPGAGGRGVAPRRMVIGTPKTLTPEQARKRAKDLLAEVVHGADPAASRKEERQAHTVKELVDAYMAAHVRPKRKTSTANLYGLYAEKHIEPALGAKKAPLLSRSDVARFHNRVGENNPVTANRLLALISAAYAYGIDKKLLPKGTENPAVGIEKFAEQSRERFLTDDELARLGESIRLAETEGIPRPASNSKHAPKVPIKIDQHAAAAIRLLIFTGARLREVLHLRWDEVDLQRGLLFLGDSKTGAKTIVLNAAAAAIVENIKRMGTYVIAGQSDDKPRADLKRPWDLISTHAGLGGLRIHDLRHSYASVGVGDSLGLPIVGKLLGHRNARTTERYAHLAVDPLRRAANTIGEKIAAAMGENTAESAQ
ncbi:tyrosine-type recombinase/integrase [Bradyrhizobium guangdongense]